MTRYIFITGGVVSSLGKGLAAASLGALLQARGFTVRLRKLDPYLNVDPGTMSPYEHGEVYVTDDGAEADLDLGHYERFTGVASRKSDSSSSGRIYSQVLENERRGKYLGETIQIIPHVTDEIKSFIVEGDGKTDFMICEIGGTIGDIEGLPFLEAIRQFALERPGHQCIFVHVTLVPYLEACCELKTKPTQHSVKELRSIGISPDVLVCRSQFPIPDSLRDKIALFCNVRSSAVISAADLSSIYMAPLAYSQGGFDRAVIEAFRMSSVPDPDMTRWTDVVDRIKKARSEVNIAIVGKYTQLNDAYKSISEALCHGGMANRVRTRIRFIGSEQFEEVEPESLLADCNGLIVPGGFGQRGSEGKIIAAGSARRSGLPFLGICFGMQMAVIEAARNLADIPCAGSEEFQQERLVNGKNEAEIEPVVFYLKEWSHKGTTETRAHGGDLGGTMRLGSYPADLVPGSRVARIYGSNQIDERHRHRYEVNIGYRERLERCGLLFSGMSPDGRLPEIVEIPDHPWFVGVQFHPELKSKPFDPHPLFRDFVRAALENARGSLH